MEYKLTDILSIINFCLNMSDVSNNEIMSELQKQDREYLEIINEKLDKILSVMKGE